MRIQPGGLSQWSIRFVNLADDVVNGDFETGTASWRIGGLSPFEPLANRRLAADIKELGQREGVKVDKVLVADASRRTTAANAYVSGIGPTKRVVFYDTILDGRFSQPELLIPAIILHCRFCRCGVNRRKSSTPIFSLFTLRCIG